MATTSIAGELAYRKQQERRRSTQTTFAADLLRELEEAAQSSTRVRFPSPAYREDPVRFCRDIIGLEPWAKQIEILEAIRDHKRVAVRSGHKVSKSSSAAIAALWYYCSFDDARVVMSSTTSRQVDQILWRELRMLRARSGRCLVCKSKGLDAYPCEHSAIIDGEAGELARTGLKSTDFREIVGFTAREAEAVAGISGKNLMYLIDEASGVPDIIFEAIEGNRAGGARIVLFSNPTRCDGEFFDAFHAKAGFYHGIKISSEDTPNAVSGRELIPGLATREWIEEKEREWGRDSMQFRVRVQGEFPTIDDTRIFSIHRIGEAEQRWHETPETGRLFIGVDPAGETGNGDDTAIAVRRGQKVIAITTHKGLTAEGHLVQILGTISKYKERREAAVVVIGRDGPIGSRLWNLMRSHAGGRDAPFELVGVRESDRAHREPRVYDRMRDELTANLEQWIREGGAIPEDAKLAGEMHAQEWIQQATGRLKITPKTELRKLLGRSPDRYDALALCCWEPANVRPGRGAQPEDDPDDDPSDSLDPYAGKLDPYGSIR